jgi:uncharacterized protein YecE (DUF72 family)
MAQSRIGISGWLYPPWRGVFYPDDLRQAGELAFASRQFPTIELNSSFYRLHTPQVYRGWSEQTPARFVFAIKGPRFITHIKRLKNVDDPLSVFFASGPLALGRKLGPFLWQLPPNFRYDHSIIDQFLARLPRRADEALAMARRHAPTDMPEAFLKRRLRHALEVRHVSFLDEDFIRLARRHGVAVVVSDGARRWPMIRDVTAGFVYLRLHGEKKLYGSRYGDASLNRWADRIQAWLDGDQLPDKTLLAPDGMPRRQSRDVYVYFDNDTKVDAPFDAHRLADRLDRS